MPRVSLNGIHIVLPTSFVAASMPIDGDAEKELDELLASLDLERV